MIKTSTNRRTSTMPRSEGLLTTMSEASSEEKRLALHRNAHTKPSWPLKAPLAPSDH